MSDCRELMEDGYTKEAAEALCDVARSIGVKPSKLISAARRLEKEGIWLTAGDWLVVKEVMDKGFSLGTIVDYIIERRRAGIGSAEIVKELPLAAAHSAKRRHLLRNLMKALEAPEYFSGGETAVN